MSRLIFLIFQVLPISVLGQCMCGHLFFKVYTTDNIEITSDNNNEYKIEYLTIASYRKDTDKIFIDISNYYDKIKSDLKTISNQSGWLIRTLGGFDTLTIKITDFKSQEAMIVDILTIDFDREYRINLGHFKKGHFLFDLKGFNFLSTDNKSNKLVNEKYCLIIDSNLSTDDYKWLFPCDWEKTRIE
jgi:hypothetical protein